MGLRYSWISDKLEVRRSSKHNFGVFVKEPVFSGEKLAVFGGKVIHTKEAELLPIECQDWLIQIDDDFVLGHTDVCLPEDTDYFNHSCNPNSGIKGQIFLVAMRDLDINEEVTFDYAMVLAPSLVGGTPFVLECTCGAKSCRKKITESDWKITELQSRYDGFFSYFITEKILNLKKYEN